MLKKILLTFTVILLAAFGSLYFFVNKEAHAQADQLIAQAMASGSYQDLSYESLSVSLLNQNITLKNVKAVDLNQFEYILQEVTISDFDLQNETPHHINISINGLSFPEGLPEITATQNTSLNLYVDSLLAEDSIPLTLNYHYDYDPENNDLIETNMAIGLIDAANFSFSARLKNIPLETLINSSNLSQQEAQAQLMPYLANAELPNLSFSLEDLGIIEAIMAIQAEEAGISPEEQRQQAKTLVQSLYLLAPQALQQAAMPLSSELANFVDGEKTLSISIEPEYNGSIQNLQPAILSAVFSGNYPMVLDLLNFKISSQ